MNFDCQCVLCQIQEESRTGKIRLCSWSAADFLLNLKYSDTNEAQYYASKGYWEAKLATVWKKFQPSHRALQEYTVWLWLWYLYSHASFIFFLTDRVWMTTALQSRLTSFKRRFSNYYVQCMAHWMCTWITQALRLLHDLSFFLCCCLMLRININCSLSVIARGRLLLFQQVALEAKLTQLGFELHCFLYVIGCIWTDCYLLGFVQISAVILIFTVLFLKIGARKMTFCLRIEGVCPISLCL